MLNNKNERTLKINGKTIKFYDYYLTNACVIKFINTSIYEIKKVFQTDIINGFEEINEENLVIGEERFCFKLKRIAIENSYLIEEEQKLIKEAWDENVVDNLGKPVIDESTGKQLVLHHEKEFQIVQNKIPVEITTVYLEEPDANEEVMNVKDNIQKIQQEMNNMKTNMVDKEMFDAMVTLAQSYAQTLTDDNQILALKHIYPLWNNLASEEFTAKTKGYKFTHKDVLYKTAKDNLTFQTTTEPGKDTETLFSCIAEHK